MGRAALVLTGPGRPYDLVLVCAMVAAAVVLSTYRWEGAPRYLLAFGAVFFAPGYALVAALFPGQKAILSQSYMLRRDERLVDITLLERLALGFGLGIALMGVGSAVLTRGFIDFNSTVAGLEAAAFTFVFSIVAIVRRARLPTGDQFSVLLHPRREKTPYTSAEKGIAIAIAAAMVVLVVVTATGLVAHPAPHPFSELSVTGANGNMEQLPTVLEAGQQGLIRIKATSHTGEDQQFILTLSLEPSPSSSSTFDPGSAVSVSPGGARSTTFELADGESWERTITFSIPSSGDRTLYITLDDGREVKRLWLPLTIT